jgi:hypothetical protein
MTHPHATRSFRHAFGNGFDFVMATPDHRRFRDWWNRDSLFRVSKPEADTILSHPEFREAA